MYKRQGDNIGLSPGTFAAILITPKCFKTSPGIESSEKAIIGEVENKIAPFNLEVFLEFSFSILSNLIKHSFLNFSASSFFPDITPVTEIVSRIPSKLDALETIISVSYTHLDVYKRQPYLYLIFH